MEDNFNDAQVQPESGSFDLMHYLTKLLRHYVWFLVSVFIALSVSFLYLRYSVPQYQVSGSILVGGGSLESGANSILANAGMLNGPSDKESAVSNEIFILQSHHINGAVVDSLRLNISVARRGNLKDEPLILDSLPVSIRIRRSDPNRDSPVYKLLLRNSSYILEDQGTTHASQYGRPLLLAGDTILMEKKSPVISTQDYSFQIGSRLGTINKYISRLTVEQAKNGGTGLLSLSLIDELPSRAYRYIGVLIHAYNASYIDYKNQATKSALKFLGERLNTISAELHDQENDVRDFKSSNQIYDISSAANQLLTNLQSIDTQKGQNYYQDKLLALVETTISKNGKEEVVASAAGLQDPILGAQVAKFNDLVFQKQMILSTGTDYDPRLDPINSQIKDLKSSILKNIQNIRNQFRTGKNYVSTEESKYSGRFAVLPQKEKEYIELTRKMTIKESQYVFLLQKKEETEIQLVSSDSGMSRTVDDVLNDGRVSPVSTNIYGAGLLIGLLIPALTILVTTILNQKIETRKEIELVCTAPILGELSFSNSSDPIVISTNKRTAIAEQLRAIRANLSFIGSGEQHKVFVVTSSMSGEGKSFLSLNLANSFAINDKKVAVLELDLRKPMLSKKLGVNNRVGISTFIVDVSISPDEIIKPVENQPNLFLVNSGPIPPNPGELIIHKRLEELIQYLRNNFDYIILDLPPIGLVADALTIGRMADISLFVIRPNYSLRPALRIVNDLYKQQKLPRLSIVVNGVQKHKGYGSYGYGNGYGYYADDPANIEGDATGIFKNIFKRFS